MTWRIRTAVALVGLLLAAACGSPPNDDASGGSGGGAAPDSPAQSSPEPSPPEDGPPGTPEEVEAQEGLVEVRPARWEEAKIVDEDTIELLFYGGVEECYGVDRVEVDYKGDRVEATLFAGSNPKAQMCIEMAVYKSYAVDLEEPLDGRKIVDGARTGPRSGGDPRDDSDTSPGGDTY